MESILPEVELLQNRLSELIVENETVSNTLLNYKFDTHEVISYLKKKVEDQDEDIARLEETIDMKENQMKYRYEKEMNELQDLHDKSENEKLDLIAQLAIIKTQLSQHQTMCFELRELTEKNQKLALSLEEKERALADCQLVYDKERNELKEILKMDIRKELIVEMEDMRSELELQKEAAIKTNRKIIERLQAQMDLKDGQIQKVEDEKQSLLNKLKEEEKKVSDLIEHNTKLRKLLEKSGKTAEKHVKDAHRQAEDAEKRRLKALNESREIISQLKSEIQELKSNLEKMSTLCQSYEKVVLKEQARREDILRAHTSQNEKLKQLKEFLMFSLGDDKNSSDNVIGEDRQAIFSKLALIINQVPIVK